MKTRRQLLATMSGLLAAGAGGTLPAGAQQRRMGPGDPPHREAMIFKRAVAGGPAGEDVTFEFISSEMSFLGNVVKGAPYSAEAITETTQTLADGNRITRKSAAAAYRDSEGRTRREQALGSIGPWAAAGEPARMIFINDPVAGVNYILHPHDRSARKLPLPQGQEKSGQAHVGVAIAAGRGGREVEGLVERVVTTAAPAGPKFGDTKTASLGKQLIEGLPVEGTRSTLTIPAGAIGNDRPIEVVSERWYSPELQTPVLTKRNDPRTGETVFRLTNVNRSEPLRSLFEVPPDYTFKEDPGVIMRKKIEQR